MPQQMRPTAVGAQDPMYAFFVANGNSTDLVYNNVGWAANGTYGGQTSSPDLPMRRIIFSVPIPTL